MSERKDRIRIQIGDQEFNVVGGTFQEMLNAVKQINGRRFVSELKVWQLPGPAEEVQRQLEISGYLLEGGAPVASPPAATTPAAAGGDRIRVLIGGQRMAVVGGNFQDMLAMVKGLPGRRFDSDTKLWEISGDPGVVKGMVEAAGFQLEGAAKIPTGPVPPMELPNFSSHAAPPPYQPPDFFDEPDDIPEPPPWWDDELAPPPVEADFFDEPMFEPGPPTATTKPAMPAPTAAGGSGGRRGGGDRVRIRLGDIPLVVSGGEFQAILALVKSIPGRRFNGDARIWELPDTVGLESLGQRVAAAGFVLEQE